MIKFFRRIRQSLLSQGKTKKYLFYAIGEITLVVIGILIALQINNWNEAQKSQAKIDLLLKKTLDELALNINSSQELINRYKQKDKHFSTVLHKKAILEDYKTNKLTYLIWNSIPVGISNNAANELKKLSEQSTIAQDSLITRISELYNTSKHLLDRYDTMMEGALDLFDEKLRNNTDWYYIDNLGQTLPDKAYEYFLNNPTYLNNVAYYETITIRNHLPMAWYFSTLGKDLHIDISKYLGTDMEMIGDISKHKHYIGTYTLVDDGGTKETIIIKEEKGILKCDYTLGGISDSFSLYPDNNNEFVLADRFCLLKRNDNKEVIGFLATSGSRKPKYYEKQSND